jgi:hypothetical protein
MLRGLLLAALFACSIQGLTDAQCVPAKWFPKTETFSTIKEVQGQGSAGSELLLEEDGEQVNARLSDYRGSAVPAVTKLRGTIEEATPVGGEPATCRVRLSGKDNRGPVQIDGEITPHYFKGVITRRIGKEVFSYRLSLKRQVSTEDGRVATLRYDFEPASRPRP